MHLFETVLIGTNIDWCRDATALCFRRPAQRHSHWWVSPNDRDRILLGTLAPIYSYAFPYKWIAGRWAQHSFSGVWLGRRPSRADKDSNPRRPVPNRQRMPGQRPILGAAWGWRERVWRSHRAQHEGGASADPASVSHHSPIYPRSD